MLGFLETFGESFSKETRHAQSVVDSVAVVPVETPVLAAYWIAEVLLDAFASATEPKR